jgi:hypothetical protein
MPEFRSCSTTSNSTINKLCIYHWEPNLGLINNENKDSNFQKQIMNHNQTAVDVAS